MAIDIRAVQIAEGAAPTHVPARCLTSGENEPVQEGSAGQPASTHTGKFVPGVYAGNAQLEMSRLRP
jgi:hypothetical protein